MQNHAPSCRLESNFWHDVILSKWRPWRPPAALCCTSSSVCRLPASPPSACLQFLIHSAFVLVRIPSNFIVVVIICIVRSQKLRMYYKSGTDGRCMGVFTHQVAALWCVKWRHGRHFKSVTSYQKSESMDAYLNYLGNNSSQISFPIRFETSEPQAFLKRVAPTRRGKTTRWVAIWDQFLIEKVSFVFILVKLAVGSQWLRTAESITR